jgi:hypothetical protein
MKNFLFKLRLFLTRIGFGACLLRLRRALIFGLRAEVNTFIAKRRYLRAIVKASPLSADVGRTDCFMLLNESRFWEGLWALYSFRFHYGPCRIVVLDDGTLGSESISILRVLLPGVQVPQFAAHNKSVCQHLEKEGLERCLAWRSSFVFFRKLIDPSVIAQNRGVILLDSDCLHFRKPEVVKSWAENPEQLLYIADLAKHSFCAQYDTLSRICGERLPEYFCAGYLCLPKDGINLFRIEEYLGAPCFNEQLQSGKFAHVAEQTLHAMEAAVIGSAILPDTYATCPDVSLFDCVAGHFCGGSVDRTWFYTKGIPHLARQLSLNS